jgi:hypothetical protein
MVLKFNFWLDFQKSPEDPTAVKEVFQKAMFDVIKGFEILSRDRKDLYSVSASKFDKQTKLVDQLFTLYRAYGTKVITGTEVLEIMRTGIKEQ